MSGGATARRSKSGSGERSKRRNAKARRSPPAAKRWSQSVTEHSDALDLEKNVFAQHDPALIARSLKRSAEHSQRRKSNPYRSAMSMLTFYINRAGRRLPRVQRRRLQDAKNELRALFGKAPRTGTPR